MSGLVQVRSVVIPVDENAWEQSHGFHCYLQDHCQVPCEIADVLIKNTLRLVSLIYKLEIWFQMLLPRAPLEHGNREGLKNSSAIE